MLAFPKPEPLAIHRAKRKAARETALEQAYREVDLRDQGVCWATGRTTRPGDPDSRVRRDHHHLAGRRVRPDWRHDPRRILTLTAEAHQLVTAGALLVEGDDATKRVLFHWNREIVKPGKEPFRLKSKRWSQNR